MCSEMVLPVRSMRTHAPQLDRCLRRHGVVYVQFQYRGVGGHFGTVDEITLTYADGSPELVEIGGLQSDLTATLLALLNERHPNWCEGDGSCGDFRWDLERNALTHSHYTLGERNERVTHHGVSSIDV
jgi:hypothetical protein